MARVSLLGMPAARRFDLQADRDKERNKQLFVVPYDDLSLGYSEMKACGIKDAYGWFENRSALGFTHAEMEKLLERSGLSMVQRYGSTLADVEWVSLRKAPHYPDDINGMLQGEAMLRYPFETKNFDGHGRYEFSYLVSRMLGPVVKRKILFEVPHGRRRSYHDRGAFQVYVWSTPHEESQTCNAPWAIWGYEVDMRDGFVPLPGREDAGVLIKDGDYAIAELFENALYIHYDIVHYGTPNEFRIMVHLLQEVAKHLSDPEGFANELLRERAVFLEEQQAAFENLVQKAIPARTKRHQAQVEEARKEVGRLRERYFEVHRILFGLEHTMLDPEVVARRFREELVKLQQGKVACVEKVVLVGGNGREFPKLHVYTTELKARYPDCDTEYLMGRYRIELRLGRDADDGRLIKMWNLDRQPENCNHPHVDSNGIPCLGNLDMQLPEYVAHFEIEAAITLAIAFLQSLNHDDHGYVGTDEFPIIKNSEKEAVCDTGQG